jgi:hypothetical protein
VNEPPSIHCEQDVIDVLDGTRVADHGRFSRTACFAADKCQLDLGCPFLRSCRLSWLDSDD